MVVDQARERGAALKSSGARGMVLGVVIIGIGVVITAVTYNTASAGGTYIFAWGPIILGILTFFRSFVQYLRGASAVRKAGGPVPATTSPILGPPQTPATNVVAPPLVPPPVVATGPGQAPDPRFAQVESHYATYRAQLAAGQITTAELDRLLSSLTFEIEGRFWMIGANSGRWYATDGGNWEPATPPPL